MIPTETHPQHFSQAPQAGGDTRREASFSQPTAEGPHACAATIGFFDGVHCGHRFLLEELRHLAHERGLRTLAITFDQHPRKVLGRSFQPKILTGREEKEALLAALADRVEVLRFTPALAALTAEEFMQTVLRDGLNVRTLLLGYDHRFGSDGLTGAAAYEALGRRLGIEVLQARQYAEGGRHVSSSAVRRLLEEGRVQDAAALLGRPYSLTGTVVAGNRIGRTLGFPTANLQPLLADQLIPRGGVYAVDVQLRGKRYRGMLNIGCRPTLALPDKGLSIEVHLFDFWCDIYGERLTVSFRRYLRDEARFPSAEALREQLEEDRRSCRAFFDDFF